MCYRVVSTRWSHITILVLKITWDYVIAEVVDWPPEYHRFTKHRPENVWLRFQNTTFGNLPG